MCRAFPNPRDQSVAICSHCVTASLARKGCVTINKLPASDRKETAFLKAFGVAQEQRQVVEITHKSSRWLCLETRKTSLASKGHTNEIHFQGLLFHRLAACFLVAISRPPRLTRRMQSVYPAQLSPRRKLSREKSYPLIVVVRKHSFKVYSF